MAELNKTDYWWNGKLAWAVNNLYYDFINVDVTRVPYATTHRNSSFFLKTRLWYRTEELWNAYLNEFAPSLWDLQVTDVKIVWDDSCTRTVGTAFIMAANSSYTKKYITRARIEDWCLTEFMRRAPFETNASKCSDWKFFTTSFVRDEVDGDLTETTWSWTPSWISPSGIQMNKYEYWTTVGLFSDADVETWYEKFINIKKWDYLYVYHSENWEDDWFAWQVRMVTWFDAQWRITVNSPWLWFKTPDTSLFYEWEERIVQWGRVSYRVYRHWWECVWFSTDYDVRVITDWYGDDFDQWDYWFVISYEQIAWESTTKIISVAEANDKTFVLTDNGYIHYSKSQWVMNKFFINEDMDAWADKTSIVAYKDFLVAFGRRKIAVWAPDEQNVYWTMYNQSTTIGTWSRYSYNEYEWDLIMVSNDRRLLALWVSNTVGRYMLQQEDVWDMLNGKLATMIDTDEAFVWSDNNNLRVFINTRDNPYVWDDWWHGTRTKGANTMTHIYKFDKLFKVWSEDHIDWQLLWWVKDWVYIWQKWLYVRDNYYDYFWDWNIEYKSKISAYLIENENNWLEWAPTLFQLAKLNRLITTLWPGRYSDNSKIHITSYVQGIGVEYEFPIWQEGEKVNNKWVHQITKSYTWSEVTVDECQLAAIEDSNVPYQTSCTDKKLENITIVQDTPWCNSYKEFLIQDHWVCVNDQLYRFSPSMPLVTSLWENQKYASQIELSLISWEQDIICFGWWLAELFVAPLWYEWSDWEYELSPESSC